MSVILALSVGKGNLRKRKYFPINVISFFSNSIKGFVAVLLIKFDFTWWGCGRNIVCDGGGCCSARCGDFVGSGGYVGGNRHRHGARQKRRSRYQQTVETGRTFVSNSGHPEPVHIQHCRVVWDSNFSCGRPGLRQEHSGVRVIILSVSVPLRRVGQDCPVTPCSGSRLDEVAVAFGK